ncbi:MAG TPA: SCO1664 family protein [Ilumatobacteraceae bacterium]|nr:SCO1664 family protein [Ilumatobacteraceae bacterium]HQY13542.1 SCO1664 family protein [Ilumatobacteraceae bacterium]HRA83319.1 SCO1664 family protein [Ilumatobacteraceae bacterium]
MTDHPLPPSARHLELLATADVDIEGRMPWSSNATFLVNLSVAGEQVGQAIYKPLRGERPLWDFEPGLHRRELAAYRLSEAMGIDLVPPTIIRDGPLGEGSLQWFVEADHQQHYFTIYENREDLHPLLRPVALFDILANNTDRKSGHVLIDADDHIWGIDHGLCFAAEFKLRTVVWEFGGEAVTGELLTIAAQIADHVPLDVAALLHDEEAAAIQERAQWVTEHRVFPVDNSGRRYPWPLV